MQNSKDKQLSKTLSWLLRHGAVKERLKISPEGYIAVNDILQHKSCTGKYNLCDIQRVVANNDKQRFKLRNNPRTNVLEIKAQQGHSIQEIDDSELKPISEPKYRTAVHGTYHKYWHQIKTQGLSCMKRRHIHFAKGTLDDPDIISGLRKDIEIYIFINLGKALADGLQFYESDNGVVLTAGNEKGYLEPKYFSKVVALQTGFPPYTRPQDLVRVFANYGPALVEKLNNRFAVLTFGSEEEAQEAVGDTKKVNIYGEFLSVRPFVGKPEKSSPKKQIVRSKLKSDIIEPQLIELTGDFHQQLDNVLNAVRLTQEEASALSALYAELECVLQQLWPGCITVPFGSITTGLGIKSSDADCFVNVPPHCRHANANFVHKAKKLLEQYPHSFKDVVSIPRANTPIVKFFHVPTETNCDLTFKTPLGAQNSRLIAFLLHADPRLIPVAVLVKYWAKVHGLSGSGKLTNYALTMLIIFYLQQPPLSILPSVASLQRDAANDVIVDDWNTGFVQEHKLLPPVSNKSTIAEILGGFFKFYDAFDFSETVVCPLMGRPMKKELFADPALLPIEFERYKDNVEKRAVAPIRFTTSMCVQDPIELCHNVASPVSSRLAAEIKAFFKFAATAYEKEKNKKCAGFLKTILLHGPPPPKKIHPEFRLAIYPHVMHGISGPDWKQVVTDVMKQMFEEMCKIKLTRAEHAPNPEAKTQKDRYIGEITKPIWKRKQFTRLYDLTDLDLIHKQSRITQEILNVNPETFKIRFILILAFPAESRNMAATMKFIDGDVALFREFGKFFITNMQHWYVSLLTPYVRPAEADPQSPVGTNGENSGGKNDVSFGDSESGTEDSESSATEVRTKAAPDP